MRIEFDPTNPDEAAAVRAMLTALIPVDYSDIEAPLGDYLRHVGETPRALISEMSDEEREFQEEGNKVVSEALAGVPSLDSTGTPWDARIHSTPAKTNADGTWRAKRGVTAEQVAAVRAEREPAVAGSVLVAGDEGPIREIDLANGTITLGDDTAQEQNAPPAPNAPAPAPKPPGQSEAPLAPAAPSATTQEEQNADLATSAAPVSFLDVMKAITAAQKDGHVTTAKVKELCAAIGAGDSTMGLNGADKGELRVQFMALLGAENGE